MLTFPLSTDDFLRRLPISRMTFELQEAMEFSETDQGDLITADLGTRLWQGEITLGRITSDEAADAITLIDVLRSAGRSFAAFDTNRPGPRNDPDGAQLGTATVTVSALSARELRLSGLPAGYVLRRGDYLGWDYGSNPVRRALHKVVDLAAMADPAGTVSFEVVPHLRAGATSLGPVRLLRPWCTAIILPGSTNPGTVSSTITEGASFRWRQTLRY
ncbi:hypothetical protein [Halodurantibacterium flavum]|uniref:Uncharacterized protein n=1 Tax=Halodurantibacterium flavum TaxID=1382802 RepID=A0ABW4S941_9RHOB